MNFAFNEEEALVCLIVCIVAIEMCPPIKKMFTNETSSDSMILSKNVMIHVGKIYIYQLHSSFSLHLCRHPSFVWVSSNLISISSRGQAKLLTVHRPGTPVSTFSSIVGKAKLT